MKIFFLLVPIIVLVACKSPPSEGDVQIAIARTKEVIPSSTHIPTSTVTPKLTSTSKPTRAREPTPKGTPVYVYIDNVNVEKRDCEYYAVIKGNNSGCVNTVEINQEIKNNIIMVTISVYSNPPAGFHCNLTINKLVEEILLETKSLVSGIYIVDVNGVTARFRLDSACAGWQFP